MEVLKNGSIDNNIPIFIINLKRRTDRKESILKEFSSRNEFSLTIVEANEHTFGALGLWNTIRYILQNMVNEKDEFIIFCEDDLQFTRHYSKKYLLSSIAKAQKRNADILLGGVSWFASAIQIAKNLFWVENFSGLQFTIIFKKFFKEILDASMENFEAADYKIASLTDKAMFIYPFISTQKEFGYSDATPNNNQNGRVTALFNWTSDKLKLLRHVKKAYVKKGGLKDIEYESFENIIIPTYIINLPERTERLEHIRNQFVGRKEFDITIVEACKHKIGAYGLWLSIRKVIQMAIDNDDDVIIICEDDHQFTEHYSKEYLLKNIIEAHEQGACFLSGGTGRFDHAIPLTENRYWVNHCLSAQFVVLYKKFFRQILEEPFNESVVADLLYSAMTSNKMVLYPFISTQKDFGYSDVTDIHNKDKGIVARLFSESDARLSRIQKAYRKYKSPELSKSFA